MKICYLPGRESSYSRTRVFLKGMRDAGVEVFDCSSPAKNFSRYIYGFLKFLRYQGKSDVVLVGFLGHFLMPLVKLFTRKPVIFDAFVSVYQTMVHDRHAFVENGPWAMAARFIDRFACRLADKVFLDTDQHIEYFVREYGIPRWKFCRVSASADDSVMYPRERADKGLFTVHFHGEFQRLHGAEYIIKAAAMLPDVRFRLIGKGGELPRCMELAKKADLDNVEFLEPVTYERLAEYIAEADVCLGIFGDTQKTRLVIPNKAYEALAMGKPLVTSDTPAAREILRDCENAVLCKAASGESIARAIERLQNDKDLCMRIARNGNETFRMTSLPRKIGEIIKGVALEICRP